MNFPFPHSWITPAAAPAFAGIKTVRFDGIGASGYRSGNFSGAAVGKKGILSFWWKLSQLPYNGLQMILLGTQAGNVTLIRQDTNKWRLQLYNADGVTAAFDIQVTTSYVADAKWHHFLASWDANTTTFQLYIDDVSAASTNLVARTNTNIQYNNPMLLGANYAQTYFFEGELGDLYFNQAANLDLTVVANRRLFIDAAGKPVDLGSNGSLPTGTAPIWYSAYKSGALSTFFQNKGTGGNLNLGSTTTLIEGSNSPSDSFNSQVKLLMHGEGNDGGTGCYDSSGPIGKVLTNNAVASTYVSPYVGAKFGKSSLYFDGTNYLQLSGSATDFTFGTGDFTIDFWINTTTFQTLNYIYDGRATGTGGAYPTILYNAAGNVIYYANGANRITGAGVLAGAGFEHIALTRAGTSTRLFLNGVQQGSTYTDSTNYLASANRPYIGCPNTGTVNFYVGYLDELRVLKGQAAWTANFTPPTAPYTP